MTFSILARVQITFYLAWVLLLIGPVDVPDPLGLGLPVAWTGLCLLAATLVWVPDLFTRGWPSTSLDRPLAIYVGLVALTSIWSVDHHPTLIAVLALLGNISIFYATVSLARTTDWLPDTLLVALVAASALVLMMALAFHAEQGLLLRPKVYAVPEGWSGYPELGALAVAQFAWLVAALLAARSGGATVGVAILLVVNLVELVFLYSRAAWLSIGAVAATATFVMIRGRQLKRLALIAGLVAAVTTFVIAGNPTSRYLARAMLFGQAPGAGAPTGYAVAVAAPEDRLQIWTRSLRMIADRPWSGVGLGNFRQVFESKYNPEVMGDGTRGVHAHNLWLQQCAELGVPGGIAYAALWLWVVWRAWCQTRVKSDFLRSALLLSVVAMATANLTTNMFYLTGGASGRLQSLTWLLFGLVMSPASLRTVGTPSVTLESGSPGNAE